MSHTDNITIKNPSRRLEECLRKIGVQKFLWLERLNADTTQPTETLYVK